jgi:thiol-disulfide isomerase/thioredoxin
MGASQGFPEKLELAKGVRTIRKLINQKNYADAKKEIANLKLPRYSGVVNMITLLKSEVMDAAGSTKSAYDSLLVIEAKMPADDINAAIIRYGKRLGKDAEQTEKDIWAIRNNTSKPAPPFELGLYTSTKKVKLEDYKGKVVLLTFWFPGCGPCRGEMPHFQNVVDKFDTNRLAYLGINVLPDQDEYVLPFMKNTKFSFTPLRGTSDWAQKTYHVRGEPTNFLIDQDGKIIYSDFMINANNERMLELMIYSILNKKQG